jgi:hypothetical protein
VVEPQAEVTPPEVSEAPDTAAPEAKAEEPATPEKTGDEGTES